MVVMNEIQEQNCRKFQISILCLTFSALICCSPIETAATSGSDLMETVTLIETVLLLESVVILSFEAGLSASLETLPSESFVWLPFVVESNWGFICCTQKGKRGGTFQCYFLLVINIKGRYSFFVSANAIRIHSLTVIETYVLESLPKSLT